MAFWDILRIVLKMTWCGFGIDKRTPPGTGGSNKRTLNTPPILASQIFACSAGLWTFTQGSQRQSLQGCPEPLSEARGDSLGTPMWHGEEAQYPLSCSWNRISLVHLTPTLLDQCSLASICSLSHFLYCWFESNSERVSSFCPLGFRAPQYLHLGCLCRLPLPHLPAGLTPLSPLPPSLGAFSKCHLLQEAFPDPPPPTQFVHWSTSRHGEMICLFLCFLFSKIPSLPGERERGFSIHTVPLRIMGTQNRHLCQVKEHTAEWVSGAAAHTPWRRPRSSRGPPGAQRPPSQGRDDRTRPGLWPTFLQAASQPEYFTL